MAEGDCVFPGFWDNTMKPYFDTMQEGFGNALDEQNRVLSNWQREAVLQFINQLWFDYRVAHSFCDVTTNDEENLQQKQEDDFDVKQIEGAPRGISAYIHVWHDYQEYTVNSIYGIGDWTEENTYGAGINFVTNNTNEDGWEIECYINCPYVAWSHWMYEVLNNQREDQPDKWVTRHITADIGGFINRRADFSTFMPFFDRGGGDDLKLSLAQEFKLMLPMWMSNLGPT